MLKYCVHIYPTNNDLIDVKYPTKMLIIMYVIYTHISLQSYECYYLSANYFNSNTLNFCNKHVYETKNLVIMTYLVLLENFYINV